MSAGLSSLCGQSWGVPGLNSEETPQAFRATKTASEMRNTVPRVEECKPCVTGVGPSRRLHVTVLGVLCTHCGALLGEYEAAFERLCQSLVNSGRGGCSVTMAAALRKSERRSPPERGKTLSVERSDGLPEPKNRFKVKRRRLCGVKVDDKWSTQTHARPCRRGFFPYQRITDALSFLKRRSFPGPLCLHSLLQQRGVCQ